MEPNESNDNRPAGNDGLNLKNPTERPPESVPVKAAGPINFGSGRALSEVGSSHPPEIAGLIQGITKTIVTSFIQQLREQRPQLNGENPWKYHPSRRMGMRPILILPQSGWPMSLWRDSKADMTRLRRWFRLSPYMLWRPYNGRWMPS
ncbi:hypothetical protein LIER_13823 [Lithospermum erythrorhizon]|uniref:Uncharacterized protein n=1 Tax=Lithospermum erythrorhizon TaxID=34254 RepID=A0AAV3Q233_LITER